VSCTAVASEGGLGGPALTATPVTLGPAPSGVPIVTVRVTPSGLDCVPANGLPFGLVGAITSRWWIGDEQPIERDGNSLEAATLGDCDRVRCQVSYLGKSSNIAESVLGARSKVRRSGLLEEVRQKLTRIHAPLEQERRERMHRELLGSKRRRFDPDPRQKLGELLRLWSDNEAVVNFVRGEGVAKGVRHMELRMRYCRERYKDGSVLIDWMDGVQIPSDKLTKLATREEHEIFTRDITGHSLLD
jgi:hypothetical protein